MASARLFDILSVTTVFLLGSTLNVVKGSVIIDGQAQNTLHELTELNDKIDILYAIKEDVETIQAYLFGGDNNEALICGKRYHVPDGALTASGSYRADYGPQCSRLGVPKPSGCASYSWCGKACLAHQWVQVDLGRTFEIHAVATQGRGDYHQWLTTYKIASLHGSKYVNYMDRSHGGDKIFHANVDQTTVVRTALVPPIRARFVRIYPLTWHGHPSARWELYGKPAP